MERPAYQSTVKEPSVSYSASHTTETKKPQVFSASEEDLFQGTLREKQEEELKRETETKLPAEENRELKNTGRSQMKNTVPVSQNTNQKKSTGFQKREPESGDFLSEPAEITHTSDSPEKTAQNLETVISVETEPGISAAESDQNSHEMAEQEPRQLELFEEKLLAPESRERIRLVGQIFDTYWLAQFGDNFYIIDQHAAHEKVYYERLVKSFREKTVDSQYLNPPLIVTLNLQEENILKENQKYFSQFGFEIEEFGGKNTGSARFQPLFTGSAKKLCFWKCWISYPAAGKRMPLIFLHPDWRLWHVRQQSREITPCQRKRRKSLLTSFLPWITLITVLTDALPLFP